MYCQNIKVLFFLFIFSVFSVYSYAQKVKTYQKSYGGSSSDLSAAMLPLEDKGFLIVGKTSSFGAGGSDILVVRTDSIGRAIWSKTYGGSSDEAYDQALIFPLDVIQTSDSNFVICSNTKSYGAGGGDIYLLKINESGKVLWSRTIGKSATDESAASIIQTADKGFILTGQSKSTSSSTGDVLVVRTNDTGGVVWSKTYASNGDEAGCRIIPDVDGKNYLIAGLANVQQYDIYLLKITGSGGLIWSKVYGDTYYDLAFDISQLSDGSIYIGGNTTNNAFGGGSGATADNDWYIIKLDSSGKIAWGKHYGNTGREAIRNLVYDATNKVFDVPGGGFSYGPGSPQSIYLARIDTAGNVKRFTTYGTSGNHTQGYGAQLVKYKDGTMGLIASADGFGAGSYDYYFIRTDSAGNTNNCKYSTQTPKTKTRKPSSLSHTTTVNSTTVSAASGVSVKNLTIGKNAGNLQDAFICEPFVAGFDWKNACKSQSTLFKDTTYRNATSWKWNFGDTSSSSNTSSSQNPTHIFSKAGSYKVKLVVVKGSNKDSIEKTVVVAAIPTAVASTKDTAFCFGDSIQLSTTATKGTFYWSPGTYLSDSLAVKPWARPYTTTNFILKVTNSGGCSATDTVKITIDTSVNCNNLTKIGGVINKYSKVESIDSCFASLTLDSVGNFKIGDKALLMQMKGAKVDTSNTSSFGEILDYNSSGKYEYITIDSISGQQVFSKNKFLNNYDAKAALQLVNIPVYIDVYIINKLTAPAWNGNTGGVLSFEATGNIFLGADIDVSGKGFRGGSVSTGSYTCHKSDYYYNSTSGDGGNKGESIALLSSSFVRGQGASANGGGGGNNHNAGGGGGGNYSAGGKGGKEWTSCGGTILTNGGVGGYALENGYKVSSIFMGGGGGASHQNNNSGTAGTNGGGLILINADRISGNNHKIVANGLDQTTTSGNDGAGGGGAGGTISLQVNYFQGSLNIQAVGGKGGNVNYLTDCMGPGGGGSGGAVLLSSQTLPTNLKANLTPGLPGKITNSGATCYNSSNGADSGRTGVILTSQKILQSLTTATRPKGNIIKPIISVCASDSFQLSATGGVKYIWHPGKMLKDSTKQTVKGKISASTKFTVEIYNSSGCFRTDTVTVAPLPSPALPAVTLQCVSVVDDNTITLTWNHNFKSDSIYFGSYNIYRKKIWESSMNLYANVTGMHTDTYTDTKATRNDTAIYVYQIRPVNTCNRNGGASLEIAALQLKYKRYNHKQVKFTWNKPYVTYTGKYVLEADNGSGYTTITTTNANEYTYIDCNTIARFRIAIKDTTKKCFSYSNQTKQLKIQDLGKPQKADLDYVTINYHDRVNIGIVPNDSTDTKQYLLYRATNNGKFSYLTAINASSISVANTVYIDSSKVDANNNSYCYKIVAVDSCGNASDTSETHCTVNLKGKSGNLRTYLSWNLYKGFAKIYSQNITRIEEGSSTGTSVGTLSISDTSFIDSVGLKCNKKYFYKLQTYENSNGNARAQSYSDTLTVIAYDSTPPKPINLQGITVASDTSIKINFTRLLKNNVSSYNIYYSINGSAFTLLKSYPGAGPSSQEYEHTGINPKKDTFCYYITAKDTCSGMSTQSSTHCSMELKGQAKNFGAALKWSAYSGFTIQKYYIEQLDKSGNWITVDSTTSTTYLRNGIGCEKWYYFRIKAKEKGGNKYASVSDTVGVYPFDTIAPAKVNMRYVSVIDKNTVEISFDKVADKDVNSYDIYFSENGGSFTKVTALPKPANNPVVYKMSNSGLLNTEDNIYCFRVFAVDSCKNNTSASSETHCTIKLKGTAGNNSASLKWTKYIGFGSIKAYKVQRKNASGWVDVASVTDTVFTDSMLTCNVAKTYRVAAIENGGDNGISNSNETIVTPYDNIKPNAPAIQYITVNNGHPYIQWSKSTSNDVRNYTVYRANSSGTYVSIASLGNVDTFTDVSADAQKQSFCYKIMAIDSCAKNQSALSAAHCDIFLQASVKGCEKAVYLNWTAYSGWSGIDKIEIYRAANGGTESLLNTLSSSATSYKDSGLDYHTQYCYRIKAFEKNGNNSQSWSNQSCKQTFFVDTAHIYTASKIVTSSTAGKIVIKWKSEKGKAHLAYHRLYYSTTPFGSYTLLADNIPVSKDSFVHSGINTRTGDHYYYLVTVDSCGTESDPSATHTPIDLDVQIGQLIHNISWTKYEGFDVQKYYVQRLNGNVFQNIDTVSASDTFHRIFPAPCNFNIFYRIAAADKDGRLAYSDTMGRTAIDTIFANAATLHNLTVTSGTGTDLTFRGSDSLDVYAYTIQRSQDGTWGTAGQVLFSSPGDTSTYSDIINTQKSQLCYTIITLDSCLNATMSKDTFCAIQLKGQELNLANALAWHGFKGYDIDKYSVLQYNNGIWDTLATTTGDTNQLHMPLPCNVPVTYKIAGEEKGGKNRITLSDSITLVPFDTVAPPQPVINYATVLDDKNIYVEWQKSDADVKKYELSIGTDKTGFAIYDTLENALSYTVSGLQTMDSTYSFRIRAIDSCSENTSIYSEIHSTIQLKGQPGNLENYLNWSAYKGFEIDKYFVYIYSNGWKLLDSTANNVMQYTHKPLACNVPQWYKIVAQDTGGKFTTQSDSLQLIPFDTIAPPKPVMHFATVLPDRTIQLSWHWDTSADAKYFDIYRSTNNSAFTFIKTVVYDSNYVDANVSPQKNNYAYHIIAVDSCNTANRSEASDSHKIINLKLSTGACVPLIRLNWNAYVDLEKGVDGYDVYRMGNNESTYTKVKSVSATQTNWVDSTVSLGITYFYKIRAFDNEVGYDSYSDTTGLAPYQFPVPQQAKMLNVSVFKTGTTNGAIYIEWEKYFVPGDTFARGYKIYHRTNNGLFVLIDKINDLTQTTYIHSGINTSNDLHEYYITVYNLCDIEGKQSTTFRPANLEVQNKNLEAILSWHPYKGEAISKYELYRIHNNATPRLIGTFTTDTAFTDTNLYCDHNYTYALKAYLATGKLSYADTVTIKAFDTIPPAKPDLYYVSVDTTLANNGKISMIWKGNNEPNRAGYRIYRSENGGPFKLHVILKNTKPGDIFWEDANIDTKNNYYAYTISAIDSCAGNESMPSDTHQTIYLKTKAFSQYNQLNWHVYEGFKNWKYTVEKQELNKPWRVLDTLDAATVSYVDSDVVCHVFYNYRIRAIEDSSLYRSLSNTSGDTAFENIAPEPPLMEFVSVDEVFLVPGAIRVKWNQSTPKDVSRYHLETSLDGINWIKLGAYQRSQNAFEVVYTHRNTFDSSYYFRVAAEDSCGNIGNYSTYHKTILFHATPGNSENILNWSAYVGWPVKQYDIYRDGQKYFSVDGNTTSAKDTQVICTKIYKYYVMAVSDNDSTIVSLSNSDSAQPYDTKAPKPVYLKTVTVSNANKEVTLNWDASPSFDARQYYIYKRSGVDGHISLLDSTTNLTYTEVQDTIAISDCYFISSVDYCNNVSERSNRGCVMILDGQSFTDFHQLHWNPYEIWKDGVHHYRVYKREDNLNWKDIGFSDNTMFNDNFINDTISEHCYQVEAIENEGTHNATSLSTTICLHQNPVVYIPNAFTPGMSEGDNDVFGPKGINMRNYKMQIFNRWGQIVYNTQNGKPWDGTFEGQAAMEGVYMYIITIDSYNTNGTKRLKGTVTILR